MRWPVGSSSASKIDPWLFRGQASFLSGDIRAAYIFRSSRDFRIELGSAPAVAENSHSSRNKVSARDAILNSPLRSDDGVGGPDGRQRNQNQQQFVTHRCVTRSR